MSEDTTTPDPVRSSSTKTPLRTYSRHGRAMKRSFSAGLPEHLTHATKGDLNVRGVLQRRADPELSARRKRARLSDSLGQRPTDVFWEHLSASAPAFIRLHNGNQSEKTVSPGADQSDDETHATANKEPGDVDADAEVLNKPEWKADKRVRTRASAMTPSSAGMDDEGGGVVRYDGEVLGDTCDEALVQGSSMKRGSRPFVSPSPAIHKSRKIRRYQDVDESLSEVTSSPAGTQVKRKQTKAQDAANDFSDFTESRGIRIPQITRARLPIDGFDSPAGPWPIPAPNSKEKYVNFKEFKEMKATMASKPNRPSDGFERGETRVGYVGKKRKIDNNDLSIGPLDTTQTGLATQKIEGPRWLRGQKKLRTNGASSLWGGGKHFGSSQFQVESDDSFEAVDADQSTSANQVIRGRSKRRISRIVSDDDEAPTDLPVEGDSDHGTADNDAQLARLPDSNQKAVSYICDADEPVDLLVFPFDKEDEDNFTVPRTPEPIETIGQLPPKRRLLHRPEAGSDTLALRPDPSVWTRDDFNVPETSDV